MITACTTILSEKQTISFQEQGFLIIKNIVEQESIDTLYRVLVNLFKKYNPSTTQDFFEGRTWENNDFHKAIAKFRHERPKHFSHMYDSMQTTVALWQLTTNKTISAVVAELMHTEPTGLTVTDCLFRMDAPSDERNKLGWHQDSAHFRQNEKGSHGIVVSMPMQDVLPQLGPLEILPGSAKLGRVDAKSTVKDENRYNSLHSQQYPVPEECFTGFEPHSMLCHAGDALFLNFDLVHRSGTNSSNMFRFTAIGRYHKMLADDFTPGRLLYRPTDKPE